MYDSELNPCGAEFNFQFPQLTISLVLDVLVPSRNNVANIWHNDTNGRHFADDILNAFLYEHCWLLFHNSLDFIALCPIDYCQNRA